MPATTTMVWGDDPDLNLVVRIGSDIYTLYNKTAKVDYDAEEALACGLPYFACDMHVVPDRAVSVVYTKSRGDWKWWSKYSKFIHDSMVFMLYKGPSEVDLERFAAHFRLPVVKRPESLSQATLPTHNVGWTAPWEFKKTQKKEQYGYGSISFMWMMEEVEKGLRKGTSTEELFATLAEVKSVERFVHTPMRVDLPLKPLLQLVKLANARGQPSELIVAALDVLEVPPEHNWYFMGSPVLKVQSRVLNPCNSTSWSVDESLVDARPALPDVTRQMLVDAKMRIRTRAAIFIQKQWHKSINNLSYRLGFKRVMHMFKAVRA